MTVNRVVTKNHYMEFQPSKEHLRKALGRSYFKKRAEYILGFCDDLKLWPKSGRGVVALSGGADSLFLMLVMKEAIRTGRINEVHAVHFNHGNRAEQFDEAKFVSEFCQKMEVSLTVVELDMVGESNFESRARELRYEKLLSLADLGDKVITGQHIDDSFEWSLMQQFKSTSLDSSLGIPVFNDKIIRPLMCMTSRQIRQCLYELSIPCLIDPTNNELDHERNYVRNVLIPKIAQKYPNYLKNYVSRANKMAFEKGLHRLEKNTQKWKRFEDRMGGIGLYCSDPNASFVGGADLLVELIKQRSQAERGSLRLQVEKMIEAQKNGKKGPMIFSGGVLGFMEKGLFYFIHQDQMGQIEALDTDIYNKISTSQIPCGGHNLEKSNWPLPSFFPFLFYSYEKKATKYFGPGLKKAHFLFPKSTELLLKKGVYFQTFTRAMSYRKGRPIKDNVSFHFL